MEASSHRHTQSFSQSLTPLPFPEDGEWGQKLQASNHGLVFLRTSLHPEALQEPPRATHWNKSNSCVTQDFVAQEPGAKTKY